MALAVYLGVSLVVSVLCRAFGFEEAEYSVDEFMGRRLELDVKARLRDGVQSANWKRLGCLVKDLG
ncbi:hypothetical protein AAHH79_34720, partial [Burkholderia pseudomallei]